MTTQASNSLHLTVGKGRGWKDAFVVGFLAIVLGGFVAHLWSPPTGAPASRPYAAAVASPASQG